MRAATYLTMLAVPLALAACDTRQETAESEDMPMAEAMPADSMPTAGQTPMQAGQAGKTASGEGTVTAINAEAGTITIKHGPVPTVNWPAMTMAFNADEAMRQKVAVGDDVTFGFRITEGGGEITSISKK